MAWIASCFCGVSQPPGAQLEPDDVVLGAPRDPGRPSAKVKDAKAGSAVPGGTVLEEASSREHHASKGIGASGEGLFGRPTPDSSMSCGNGRRVSALAPSSTDYGGGSADHAGSLAQAHQRAQLALSLLADGGSERPMSWGAERLAPAFSGKLTHAQTLLSTAGSVHSRTGSIHMAAAAAVAMLHSVRSMSTNHAVVAMPVQLSPTGFLPRSAAGQGVAPQLGMDEPRPSVDTISISSASEDGELSDTPSPDPEAVDQAAGPSSSNKSAAQPASGRLLFAQSFQGTSLASLAIEAAYIKESLAALKQATLAGFEPELAEEDEVLPGLPRVQRRRSTAHSATGAMESPPLSTRAGLHGANLAALFAAPDRGGASGPQSGARSDRSSTLEAETVAEKLQLIFSDRTWAAAGADACCSGGPATCAQANEPGQPHQVAPAADPALSAPAMDAAQKTFVQQLVKQKWSPFASAAAHTLVQPPALAAGLGPGSFAQQPCVAPPPLEAFYTRTSPTTRLYNPAPSRLASQAGSVRYVDAAGVLPAGAGSQRVLLGMVHAGHGDTAAGSTAGGGRWAWRSASSSSYATARRCSTQSASNVYVSGPLNSGVEVMPLHQLAMVSPFTAASTMPLTLPPLAGPDSQCTPTAVAATARSAPPHVLPMASAGSSSINSPAHRGPESGGSSVAATGQGSCAGSIIGGGSSIVGGGSTAGPGIVIGGGSILGGSSIAGGSSASAGIAMQGGGSTAAAPLPQPLQPWSVPPMRQLHNMTAEQRQVLRKLTANRWSPFAELSASIAPAAVSPAQPVA